jgi:site-specific DNA-methyltransferase (adenine-specific)/modification methylase
VYATTAEKMRAYRLRRRRKTEAPDAVCRTLGPCTLYCSPWEPLYALLPRRAAVVTDPPYDAGYDVTKTRRRPSAWDRNFAGYDQAFDPTPWLRFPEVILFGADHYRERLPRSGSWICWDKLAGTTPADFAPGEWAWTSRDIAPQFIPHLWRGGQRAGEENTSRLQHKYHPAQKPVSVMRRCVQLITPGLVIIDPFMGSGSTLVACVREGYSCIGIEMDERYFQIACTRVEHELQQLALFA